MMFFALTFAAISQSIIMKKYFNLPERSFSMCGTSLTLLIKQEIRAPFLTFLTNTLVNGDIHFVAQRYPLNPRCRPAPNYALKTEITFLHCISHFIYMCFTEIHVITSKRKFGHPNQIYFLNPECVRIPWVLAPKNFPVQNFRVRSVLQKSSIFH